jgi:hypothetical protein
MSELSIHELETEHAEVLPEREALSFLHIGGGNHVTSVQVAVASASRGDDPMATATNTALILVG